MEGKGGDPPGQAPKLSLDVVSDSSPLSAGRLRTAGKGSHERPAWLRLRATGPSIGRPWALSAHARS